jgi:hypothetical protein
MCRYHRVSSAEATDVHSYTLRPSTHCKYSITVKPQNSLQSQCPKPIFLIVNIPDSSKPKHQWLSSIIEYRPSCDRGLCIRTLTVVQSLFCNPCLCFLSNDWLLGPMIFVLQSLIDSHCQRFFYPFVYRWPADMNHLFNISYQHAL